MSKASKIPHVSFPVIAVGLALVTWLVLRIVLWLYLGPQQLTPGQTMAAFVRGLWFDSATLAWIVAPWLLVSALAPNRWRTSATAHLLRWGLLWVVVAALLFDAVSEFLFWDEFTTRFNFIAVDYLIYTQEVIGNIQQSYPVGVLLSAIAAAALLAVIGIRRKIRLDRAPIGLFRRATLLTMALLLPMGSWALASVEQMQTENAYAGELSGNGLFAFAAAMRHNELDYDRFYRTIPQEIADARLAALGVQRQPLALPAKAAAAHATKQSTIGPFKQRPRNVVLISVESLSADFMGLYGSQHGLTPRLDKLANEGYRFDRLFATGTRTVRGLEALSVGTPPTPGQSIVRRPGNEHLATIGEILEHQGYATLFVYGGYGMFDNMNQYFRDNDYQVVDRTNFPDDTVMHENVWGVADEALFNNTLTELDRTVAEGKPFFAHVMTTSNHRPYTYPDGRIDIPSPGGRAGAIKYTDYAIGKFIDDARSKPWFKDTLFVIVADHCASVAGRTSLPVARYHIPAILYAPDLLAPGNDQRLVSQIDLAPTLLEVLGADGSELFYGHSLFADAPQPERAFISNYQELGYYKNGILTVLSPREKVEAFRIDPQTLEATPMPVDPALADEATAYYQSASRAFRDGDLGFPAHNNVIRRQPPGTTA
ncbi:MAG: LTA synthase family protein [Nitrospirota bacterium]|nr:LTA synthase family protein [Nitrospirota bacterium]